MSNEASERDRKYFGQCSDQDHWKVVETLVNNVHTVDNVAAAELVWAHVKVCKYHGRIARVLFLNHLFSSEQPSGGMMSMEHTADNLSCSDTEEWQKITTWFEAYPKEVPQAEVQEFLKNCVTHRAACRLHKGECESMIDIVSAEA
jgi:hypothetical protein